MARIEIDRGKTTWFSTAILLVGRPRGTWARPFFFPEKEQAMKYLAVIFLLLAAGTASAQNASYPRDLTLSWINADSYVDGTAIEAGDLTGVRLECFRQNDTVPIFTSEIPAAGEGVTQSEVFTGAIPQPGTYTCYGYSIVVGGIESDASNPAQRKYVGKPNPPASWRIEAQ